MSAKKWTGAVELDVEALDLDEDNPNVMSDETFSTLVKMIEEQGFDEPLQVVPRGDRFVLLGGEHRLKAAKVLGMKTVPCVVKEGFDDDVKRKTAMVQRNLVKGDVDKVKFCQLMKKIQEASGVDLDQIRQNMGVEEERFNKLVKATKERNEDLEEAAGEENRKTEIQVIDNLHFVINDIMAKYGETIPFGYMVFAHKNRLHLILQCDKPLYELTQRMAAGLKRDGQEINEFLAKILGPAVKEAGWEGLPLTDAKPYEPEDPEFSGQG